MKIILAGNICGEILISLKKMGFTVIKTPHNSNLLPGLGYHPDMQITKINNVYVCDLSLYDYYAAAFDNGEQLFAGASVCTGNYPGDIAYNIKVFENKVFHNFKYTDPVVKSYISDKLLIDVPQGYSGCSISNVCDRGIITQDRVIAQKAMENGIDALLITPGHIILEGFNYGFIGGASFCFGNTVFFFGSLISHPDGSRILEFCRKKGADVCELTKNPLSDYGSAVAFD